MLNTRQRVCASSLHTRALTQRLARHACSFCHADVGLAGLSVQMEYSADELQSEWVDGLLAGQRDALKAYERAGGDMEAAQSRYLALRKVRPDPLLPCNVCSAACP